MTLFLIAVLFVTNAVTITLLVGVAVYAVRVRRKALAALRSVSDAYESLLLERAYLCTLLSERAQLMRHMPAEPLFVPNRSNVLH